MMPEIAAGELHGRIDDVEEMVRNAFLLMEGDLVGEDVEAAVDLHGVGADDLEAGEVAREVDGQPGLAGARRAHDHDHRLPSPAFGRRRGVAGVGHRAWRWRRGGGRGEVGHLDADLRGFSFFFPFLHRNPRRRRLPHRPPPSASNPALPHRRASPSQRLRQDR